MYPSDLPSTLSTDAVFHFLCLTTFEYQLTAYCNTRRGTVYDEEEEGEKTKISYSLSKLSCTTTISIATLKVIEKNFNPKECSYRSRANASQLGARFAGNKARSKRPSYHKVDTVFNGPRRTDIHFKIISMANEIKSRKVNGALTFAVPDEQVALELSTIVKFMREDKDHSVFRRFERLNLYNLLVLQRKLAALDDQISTKEKAWDGPGLASSLAEVEPLVRRYSRLSQSLGGILINAIQMKPSCSKWRWERSSQLRTTWSRDSNRTLRPISNV